MSDPRVALLLGAQVLGLELPEAQADQLLNYLALLQRWNKTYNLSAVRGPAEMLTHHLLDSLAVIGPLRRYAEGRALRLLDVGSGGGLPGVVIAVTCSNVHVTCVDAVGKKAAFVRQAALSLALPNLLGLHARVENLPAAVGAPFDVLCSRAFASLADFTAWSRASRKPEGVWMAMKGKHPAQEIAALPADVEVFHVEQLAVPGLDAERCLIWMRPHKS